jgi:hypothetical protein
MGLVSLFKGAKAAWYAVKKAKPKVKKLGAGMLSAAKTIGTFAAADLVGSQMSKALAGPAGFGGSLPALPGMGGLSALTSRPGASIQSAMPDVLDTSVLKTYYRAPKGYVIVRDPSSGSVVAVRKAVARAYKLWRPARKPPISASDWHHYQRNQALEKKLLKIAGPAYRKHHTKHAGGVPAKKGR